jgi:hypothetical protein
VISARPPETIPIPTGTVSPSSDLTDGPSGWDSASVTRRFSDDGGTITGAWELNHGETWEKDFDPNYFRVE